ncbi:MAG: alpha/beta hydrolase [Candidatus Aminicenantes bacterium]|nr:alpha/beta hydrolase [Candidatus Aminicenantes bacterium]
MRENKKNLRTYGKAPFNIAVIHGGPGAPGSAAPLARELSTYRGVLEPLQTADSLAGQVQELKTVLEKHGEPPITLVGWSWGAMLGFIFAARFPELVKKTILVGSGVFAEEYAAGIMETRLSRLRETEKEEVLVLINALNDPDGQNKDALLGRFGELCCKADCFDPIVLDTPAHEYQYHIHERVWRDAAELRASGKLLKLAKQIQSPVVAIHGDYDPHPAEGVREPLSEVLKDFRFILIENCGHYPWLEREARQKFFKLLQKEL